MPPPPLPLRTHIEKGRLGDSPLLFGVSSSFETFFFMLHLYGNLLYLLVFFVFSSYLIAFYDYLEASLCVFKKKKHSLSAFSGALVLVLKKKKKTKSQSRAVTVKCCRSRCDLDLEHRNNNCTFSIFISCIFLLHHVWLWLSEWTLSPPAFQVDFREKKKKDLVWINYNPLSFLFLSSNSFVPMHIYVMLTIHFYKLCFDNSFLNRKTCPYTITLTAEYWK